MLLLVNNSCFYFDIFLLEEEFYVVGFDYEESFSGLFQCWLELVCLCYNLLLNNLLVQVGVLMFYDEQYLCLIYGEVVCVVLGVIGI